jgi:hypothetical protein
MALHHDLLEQADHLASREPRRPRQASLRRAVSAAYYAVFHLLAAEGAKRFSPPQRLLRAQVARAFAHREMQDVCRQFAAGSLSRATAALLTSPLEADLRNVVQAFVELQNDRHAADYDLSANFDRFTVLQTVRTARQAFAAWDVVKNRSNASVFLAALLLQRQWR